MKKAHNYIMDTGLTHVCICIPIIVGKCNNIFWRPVTAFLKSFREHEFHEHTNSTNKSPIVFVSYSRHLFIRAIRVSSFWVAALLRREVLIIKAQMV